MCKECGGVRRGGFLLALWFSSSFMVFQCIFGGN